MKSMILAALLCSHIAAAAPQLKFSSIEGWRVVELKNDPVLGAIFADSDYVLLVANKNAELKPTVRVRSLGVPEALAPAETKSWSRVIFRNKSKSQTITAEKVIRQGGQFKYLAEFRTDVGTSALLHSILMATLVDGDLRVFIYEQNRDAFLKNIAPVRQLLTSVEVAVLKY